MDGHHMAAPWSESWPRSGMTRNGELYPLPTQARHTSATGGGSWHIPTPMADEGGARENTIGGGLRAMAKTGKWPTPKASRDGVSERTLEMVSEGIAEASLDRVVLMVGRWPTPTSTERSGTNPNTGRGRRAATGTASGYHWTWRRGCFPRLERMRVEGLIRTIVAEARLWLHRSRCGPLPASMTPRTTAPHPSKNATAQR
jgi:hypothetical protein